MILEVARHLVVEIDWLLHGLRHGKRDVARVALHSLPGVGVLAIFYAARAAVVDTLYLLDLPNDGGAWVAGRSPPPQQPYNTHLRMPPRPTVCSVRPYVATPHSAGAVAGGMGLGHG